MRGSKEYPINYALGDISFFPEVAKHWAAMGLTYRQTNDLWRSCAGLNDYYEALLVILREKIAPATFSGDFASLAGAFTEYQVNVWAMRELSYFNDVLTVSTRVAKRLYARYDRNGERASSTLRRLRTSQFPLFVPLEQPEQVTVMVGAYDIFDRSFLPLLGMEWEKEGTLKEREIDLFWMNMAALDTRCGNLARILRETIVPATMTDDHLDLADGLMAYRFELQQIRAFKLLSTLYRALESNTGKFYDKYDDEEEEVGTSDDATE